MSDREDYQPARVIVYLIDDPIVSTRMRYRSGAPASLMQSAGRAFCSKTIDGLAQPPVNVGTTKCAENFSARRPEENPNWASNLAFTWSHGSWLPHIPQSVAGRFQIGRVFRCFEFCQILDQGQHLLSPGSREVLQAFHCVGEIGLAHRASVANGAGESNRSGRTEKKSNE